MPNSLSISPTSHGTWASLQQQAHDAKPALGPHGGKHVGKRWVIVNPACSLSSLGNEAKRCPSGIGRPPGSTANRRNGTAGHPRRDR
jgi:hypothetical protein